MSYQFEDHFVLRQPLLPIINEISPTNAIEIFEKHDIVKEAIYVASPELYREISKQLSQNGVLEEKIQNTLFKYLNRMSRRCTPFGLFATCSTGVWGEKNHYENSNSYNITRITRLDMLYLSNLYSYLVNHETIQESTQFLVNSSLYRKGKEYRYLEERTSENKGITYQITEISHSEELQNILQLTGKGCGFFDLVNELLKFDYDQDECIDFIRECIKSQVLVAEFQPSVTGGDNLRKIIKGISHIQDLEIQHYVHILKDVDRQLSSLDEKTNTEENYKNILKKLEEISGVPVKEKNLVQVDSFRKNHDFTLEKSLQNKILESIDILSAITPKENRSTLDLFKKKFYDRYEDAFIPLVDVIDVESGLGYPLESKDGFSDLLEGIKPSMSKKKSSVVNLKIDNRAKAMQDLIIESSKKDLYEVSIDKVFLDKNKLDSEIEKLPLSMSASVELLSENKIYLEYFSGPSAINVLSRFGHGLEEIHSLVSNIVEKENNICSDFIITEIAHLPQGREGNIVLHPKYRGYEIPFLTGHNNDDNIIPITDLEIGLDNDLLILRSKKLKKIIIPRLSNAHNYYRKSTPLYYFLSDIQAQFSKRSLSFDWPRFSYQPDFFPRLTINDIIISPASWNVSMTILKKLLTQDRETLDNINKRKIPRLVVFAEADNTLTIDLHNTNSVKMLIDACKSKEIIILKEYLEPSKIFETKEGLFTNQLFIPLVRTSPNNEIDYIRTKSRIDPDIERSIQRDFLPGSEWIYFKLYGGQQSLDKLLSDDIHDLLFLLKQNGLIDQWFFIRFFDPNYHIRLRFHLSEINNLGQVINTIYSYINKWTDNKVIYKVIIDTYTRELDRYLYTGINDIEKIFFHDSESIVKYLKTIKEEPTDKMRWLFALKSIDRLLNDFDLELESKIEFLYPLSTYFQKEFDSDKQQLQKINQKFKKNRDEIHIYMTSDILSNDILNDRTEAIMPFVNNITGLYENTLAIKPINSLLSDFTHMLANRLFQFNPRFHEMIVYEILIQYYKYIKFRFPLP